MQTSLKWPNYLGNNNRMRIMMKKKIKKISDQYKDSEDR